MSDLLGDIMLSPMLKFLTNVSLGKIWSVIIETPRILSRRDGQDHVRRVRVEKPDKEHKARVMRWANGK